MSTQAERQCFYITLAEAWNKRATMPNRVMARFVPEMPFERKIHSKKRFPAHMASSGAGHPHKGMNPEQWRLTLGCLTCFNFCLAGR